MGWVFFFSGGGGRVGRKVLVVNDNYDRLRGENCLVS